MQPAEKLGKLVTSVAKFMKPEDHVIIFLGVIGIIATSWIPTDYLTAYFVILGEIFKWMLPTWAFIRIISELSPFVQQLIDAWDKKTCVNCNPKEKK